MTDQTALKRGAIRILVPVVEVSSIFLNHSILKHLCLTSHKSDINNGDPNHTWLNAASDQGLHGFHY